MEKLIYARNFWAMHRRERPRHYALPLRDTDMYVRVSARRMHAFLSGRDCSGGRLQPTQERWAFVIFDRDLLDGVVARVTTVYSSVPCEGI